MPEVVWIDEAVNDPRVDQRGVDATVLPYLAKFRKTPACIVFEFIDGVLDGGVMVRKFIDGPSAGFLLWRVSILHVFILIDLTNSVV